MYKSILVPLDHSELAEKILPEVAEKILDVCKRQHIELIAMSTHGRSGISRWLLGSVAEKVVRHSQIPVLLYRSAKLVEG